VLRQGPRCSYKAGLGCQAETQEEEQSHEVRLLGLGHQAEPECANRKEACDAERGQPSEIAKSGDGVHGSLTFALSGAPPPLHSRSYRTSVTTVGNSARCRRVRSNAGFVRGNSKVLPLPVSGVSIDVALDSLSDKRGMTQGQHVFCAWNDFISTSWNMVPKNLCESSVGDSRLLAAHDERRKR